MSLPDSVAAEMAGIVPPPGKVYETFISILRGLAASAFGTRRVRMPLDISALAFPWSRLSGIENCR